MDLRELLNRNKRVFASNLHELPGVNGYRFKFKEGFSESFLPSPKLDRFDMSLFQSFKTEFDELEQAGIICKVESPDDVSFAFPTIIINKKDNSKKPAINFRSLNKWLKKFEFPLIDREQLLSMSNPNAIVSCLDLKSAYYQIKIHPLDQHYTLFQLPWGIYYWTRIPYGILNCPQWFSSLLETALKNQLLTSVFSYIDDLLVMSPSYQDHIKDLDRCLHSLYEAGFRVSLKKSIFATRDVVYLGKQLNFSSNVISLDPRQRKIIQEAPVPTSVPSFLSLLGIFLSSGLTLVSYMLRDVFTWGREQSIWKNHEKTYRNACFQQQNRLELIHDDTQSNSLSLPKEIVSKLEETRQYILNHPGYHMFHKDSKDLIWKVLPLPSTGWFCIELFQHDQPLCGVSKQISTSSGCTLMKRLLDFIFKRYKQYPPYCCDVSFALPFFSLQDLRLLCECRSLSNVSTIVTLAFLIDVFKSVSLNDEVVSI